MIELRQYIDSSGRNAFERWFARLDDITQTRVTVALDRVERGNLSAVKGLGGGLVELRLDFGQAIECIAAGMETPSSSF